MLNLGKCQQKPVSMQHFLWIPLMAPDACDLAVELIIWDRLGPTFRSPKWVIERFTSHWLLAFPKADILDPFFFLGLEYAAVIASWSCHIGAPYPVFDILRRFVGSNDHLWSGAVDG